ncbi:MAG: leucine-rich repeat protein [Ruminococcus sp.]
MKFRKIKALVTAGMALFAGTAAVMPEMGQNEITAKAEFWLEEEEEPTYTYGDLTYTVSNDAVTITDCSDTAVNVEVPTEIDGMPVKGIGSYAFANLPNLETLIIPECVDNIGESAFIQCKNLTALTLPKQVERFGNSVYWNGTEIDPETGEEIDVYGESPCIDMFSGCESLTEIELPEGAAGFEYGGGFYGCTSLRSLYIPSTVSKLYDGNRGGFEGDMESSLCSCTALETITIHPDNQSYAMIDGALIGDSFWSEEETGDFLDKCTVVRRLDNGDTSYKVPDTVKYICYYAFSDNTSLEEIILPEGLKHISRGAFSKCPSLQSLNIPASVDITLWGTFEGCASLKEITVSEGNDYFYSVDGALYTSDLSHTWMYPETYDIPEDSFSALIVYPAAKEETSLTVPDVDLIFGSAFHSNQNLEEVIIPEGVKNVNDYCFSMSKALKTVSLPSTLEYIGQAAFYECTNLTDVILPASLESIGRSAFHDCSSLGKLNIPANVSSIGDYVFEGYTGLTEITVDPANENFTAENGVLFNKDMTKLIAYPAANTDASYTVPSTVTEMSDSSFHSARNLKEVILPESITVIPSYAFSRCNVMEKVTLPSSLTTINESAFYECESLKEIEIPESVTSIGDEAFVNCANLDSIKILNAECVIYDSADTIADNAVIYGIPGSTAEAYAKEYGRIFVSLDNEGLFGDVDHDGAVSIADAAEVLSYYAKGAAGMDAIFGSDEEEHKKTSALADVNSDGEITIQDASLILSYYSKSAAGITGGWNAVLNG